MLRALTTSCCHNRSRHALPIESNGYASPRQRRRPSRTRLRSMARPREAATHAARARPATHGVGLGERAAARSEAGGDVRDVQRDHRHRFLAGPPEGETAKRSEARCYCDAWNWPVPSSPSRRGARRRRSPRLSLIAAAATFWRSSRTGPPFAYICIEGRGSVRSPAVHAAAEQRPQCGHRCAPDHQWRARPG